MISDPSSRPLAQRLHRAGVTVRTEPLGSTGKQVLILEYKAAAAVQIDADAPDTAQYVDLLLTTLVSRLSQEISKSPRELLDACTRFDSYVDGGEEGYDESCPICGHPTASNPNCRCGS